MLIIGHEQSYKVLEQILQALESSGYTRLCQYKPGESVLFDSNPAPGYVPGVKGKKETGVEYVPKVDGTRLHIYYIAKDKADKRAIKEAARAIRTGFDAREILGSLVSIRRLKSGAIQLQFVASNRDVVKDGVITDEIPLRSVSVTSDCGNESGVIIAMAFDQSLGIPYHQLKQMAESEELKGKSIGETAGALTQRVRAAASGYTQADPQQAPEQAKEKKEAK